MTIQRRDGTIAKNWMLTSVPVTAIEAVREAAFGERLTMREWILAAIAEKLEKDAQQGNSAPRRSLP
ncbi:MAG: hypothetical protein QGG34_05555 [SAR202 cluster bacterium]|jgi:hypothetical protein|nr:hypothetical protein [SAR202 cluster bacterium]MDP6300024.1 hypothetical protein [SAR202 cluster bacterium]MDP7224441.1 hypothetical protein [SAR202 cluster bacterium]MDP7413140.1 hypothetical protein [SAR202 cluster bacterium]HJO80976.1 hypothetical protein [SAR202 cluster bacterium]|tara:strand:- start:2706 stop:2906 length:201 start_codon:yes stop_codon:yes gene_type:complete